MDIKSAPTKVLEAMAEAIDDELESRAERPLWNGLFERPSDDAPYWEPSGGIAPPIYRDPETGETWQDYPQSSGTASIDYKLIASGNQNVATSPWNAAWMTAEFYNEWNSERGLQRVAEYKGELRSDPNTWPEPWRSTYLNNH